VIVGSNPTRGMDVYMFVRFSVFVLSCALRRADHSSKESYRLYKKIRKLKYEARAQERAVEPLEKKSPHLRIHDFRTTDNFSKNGGT
jgi:hypothetical protein